MLHSRKSLEERPGGEKDTIVRALNVLENVRRFALGVIRPDMITLGCFGSQILSFVSF